MLKQKQRDSKRRQADATTSSQAPVIVATELTDDEKKSKTEAVAAEIKASLERHGCALSVSRWIDDEGRIQAGMTITVKPK
jgi:hypothetical protein